MVSWDAVGCCTRTMPGLISHLAHHHPVDIPVRCSTMPPPAVRTVRDLLYWQYAKIISESSGAGKRQYGFVMDRFKKLRSGEIAWSTSIREWVRERESARACIYCGATGDLSTDHLVPRARGGPDVADNAVVACRACNSSKGDRGVYEWFGLQRKDTVPRVAEGKYLKLLYQMHERMGTLDAGRDDLERLCRDCEVGYLCEESRLTVYCLESVLMRTAR
jgi:5-methylcytosine-specific restriction endonuclease McrA